MYLFLKMANILCCFNFLETLTSVLDSVISDSNEPFCCHLTEYDFGKLFKLYVIRVIILTLKQQVLFLTIVLVFFFLFFLDHILVCLFIKEDLIFCQIHTILSNSLFIVLVPFHSVLEYANYLPHLCTQSP